MRNRFVLPPRYPESPMKAQFRRAQAEQAFKETTTMTKLPDGHRSDSAKANERAHVQARARIQGFRA
jgi:hypothetical protein